MLDYQLAGNLSWRSLAVRVVLFAIGYGLLTYSGRRFGTIRQQCTFACDAPAGIYAAIQPVSLLMMLSIVPARVDSLGTRVLIRAATVFFLLMCGSVQTLSHFHNVIRVFSVECPTLYESSLACYGSLARNGLGVAIGVACVILLSYSLLRMCCAPASADREMWWLWLSLRVFLLGIGVNILITCPLIAFGDEAFRGSIDAITFIAIAGPAYLGFGLWATHERRYDFDTMLSSW